jgi:hypothetical protein
MEHKIHRLDLAIEMKCREADLISWEKGLSKPSHHQLGSWRLALTTLIDLKTAIPRPKPAKPVAGNTVKSWLLNRGISPSNQAC